VVVDWAVTNVATTEVWNERFAELVKQRATEQDWNSRRTGVGIDVDHASRLHVSWVESHYAVVVVGDLDAVQLKQARNNLYVADVWHLTQLAGGVAKQRGNHCLGN
jgi:hypothetical protein